MICFAIFVAAVVIAVAALLLIISHMLFGPSHPRYHRIQYMYALFSELLNDALTRKYNNVLLKCLK